MVASSVRVVVATPAVLAKNARIETVREMRDRITDLIKRRRYNEAAQVARDVIDGFPETQAAVELRSQLPALVSKANAGEGHFR